MPDSIATHDSAQSALSALENIVSKGTTSIVDVAKGITEAGLLPSDIISLLDGYLDSELNSLDNQNAAPSQKIYPSKDAGDAPYSTTEDIPRAAIHIAISPDFHGTVVGSLVCPALEAVVCTPSLFQQGWESLFINTLRSDGGDSAYAPTTTVYSTFDEIAQPMSGPNASAILGDIRSVGVTNVHLQSACAAKPAGGIYTHGRPV